MDVSSVVERLQGLLGMEGLSVTSEHGQIKLRSTSPDIIKFLSDNGVEVYLDTNRKLLGEVGLSDSTLTLGNVGSISTYNTIGVKGNRTVIVLGGTASRGKIRLNDGYANLLRNQYPTYADEIEYSETQSATHQNANVQAKKF